jgi:hypothetical protein
LRIYISPKLPRVELNGLNGNLKENIMTKTQNTVSMLTVLAVLLGLFAAPALAIAASKTDRHGKITGAGFVLMVSLQRNAG